MDLFHGPINDVVVCEDLRSGRSNYYTVLVIHDHETVKKLIRILETSEYGNECYVDMFDYRNHFCVVFPYVKERKLSQFYMPGELKIEQCEEICLSLLLQCVGSKLPYPLLYLILEQEQIHLLKDGSVVLGYAMDLSGLDDQCGEDKCAMQCAILIRDMLKDKSVSKSISYQLLMKKIPKQRYQTIREVYKDVQLSMVQKRKRGLRKRFQDWLFRNQSTLFRILLYISVILLILTLIMVFSNIIWGDIPFLRILFNSFKKIGTESMLK